MPDPYKELAEQIRQIVESQEHDYSSSAQALVDASELVFNLVAKRLGNTGFQASWAALTLLRRLNGWECPIAVFTADEMLYPQYQTPEQKARKLAEEWGEWVRDEARKLLADYYTNPRIVAPRVLQHWQKMASEKP